MLLNKNEIEVQNNEEQERLQKEILFMRQRYDREKHEIDMETRKMRGDKQILADDLDRFSTETFFKKKTLEEEIEQLVYRRKQEENRLNRQKPNYDVLFPQLEEQKKAVISREQLVRESFAKIRDITLSLEEREKKVKEKEDFLTSVEGESFLTKLNNLEIKK